MTDELPGYRTSSARRTRRPTSVLTAAVVGLAAIFLVLTILQRGRREELPPKPPASPTQPPARTATVTPTVLVERSSEWVVALAPTATPSPWPALPPPLPVATRPPQSPTPRMSDCVSYRWSANQVFRPSAQVLVEIQAVNRCNRDLGPLDLWFEITGWRQGAHVQSVRGHPFDRVRRGGSGIIAIGLPGSIDWYDEITVEIVD